MSQMKSKLGSQMFINNTADVTAREVLQKTYAHFQASAADKQKLTIPIISGSPAIAFAKNHPQVLHNHKNHMLVQQNQHHGIMRMDGEAIAVFE